MADRQNIVVVGGGLCGLAAATILQKDYTVSILDKGFGIGGRLASRRLRSGDEVLGLFDYGMQYFTAEHPTFCKRIEHLIEQNVVTQWGKCFKDSDGNERKEAHALYRGVDSNRAIAQYLAKDLNVINQIRVERLAWENRQWLLHTTDERVFKADAVLMTAPVPQAVDIFDQSNLTLSDELRSQLKKITYAPCLSLMAVFDQPSSIPAPGGLKLKNSILYWIASNYQKGISEGYAVTLLASPEYSQASWDREPEQIVAEMLEAANNWMTSDGAIATRLHHWRYSYPTQVFGARSVRIDNYGPLVLAGDAFCKAPVEISQSLEQAYLSGIDAAQSLMEFINPVG